MKFPKFGRVTGSNVNDAYKGKHEHSYENLISFHREGLRIQCWCGKVVTYTPYMDIEVPRREAQP